MRLKRWMVCAGFLAAWAAGWTEEAAAQIRTFESPALTLRVDPACGTISVQDKRSGYIWRQPDAFAAAPDSPAAPDRFRNVEALPAPASGLSFETDLGVTKGAANVLHVTIALEGDAVVMDTDCADRAAVLDPFRFLEGFVLDTPKPVLAIADYCDGHLYPLDGTVLPKTYFMADRLDMPWVGICDLERGLGYILIIETSDDGAVGLTNVTADNRVLTAPHVDWHPSKGALAYPRRIRYRFFDTGGYVALAKAYRAYARDKGLLVTLAEKRAKNPNLDRLFGAPDVWGNATLAFAQEAKAAGVEKMLIQGRSKPEEGKAINELGYLTSEYDNYTDILPLEPGQEPDGQHDALPEAAVMKADGERLTAWLTWDKKLQYMKRSPALWRRTAELVVPKVLRDYPFLGRFIDVTTAEGLYEDYDPDHPLTRADKRRCGEDLLGYVRSLGLVTGGEHGIWWAVPHLDYVEGMMSSYQFFWPAGHLIRPKSKDESFTDPWGNKLGSWDAYAQWGIGHQWRAPLWELVFHDCIVTTWYWGDASDFLMDADADNMAKKDAFNILYGTIPLLWAVPEGAWQRDRERFLRTYRNTCKLHEAIAETEMVDHAFLTPDHSVQRTRFSDGTEVTVNFGSEAYAVKAEDGEHLLPQNGFYVRGPRITQSLELINGVPVTSVRSESFTCSGRAMRLSGNALHGSTIMY